MNNKQIKELAEQSGFVFMNDYPNENYAIIYKLEKFARLIETNVIERVKTVGLINERGEVLTLGTSWRINE